MVDTNQQKDGNNTFDQIDGNYTLENYMEKGGLCWPSRMQIYGFVENHTFLEQFVRMGVPAQFSQPCMASSG